MAVADSFVDLADAIDGLRAELTQAINSGAGQGMHFRLNRVELTVHAAVKRVGQGKVGWRLVEVGGMRESVTTQSLTLVLDPVWMMQDGTLVDPLISGAFQSPHGPGLSVDAALPPPDPDND